MAWLRCANYLHGTNCFIIDYSFSFRSAPRLVFANGALDSVMARVFRKMHALFFGCNFPKRFSGDSKNSWEITLSAAELFPSLAVKKAAHEHIQACFALYQPPWAENGAAGCANAHPIRLGGPDAADRDQTSALGARGHL
jgi:hypothetical protein